MRAFRGVPGEMTVDFGKGDSIVIYGDNGTGKSTIADALEWYFTGEIELLSHEGRQHAVRYVGGECDGVTSVEVVTNGSLGGKVVFPDERNAGDLPARSAVKRSCFADARWPTSSTRPRRRSGRRWSKSSAWTPSRAFARTFSARGTSFGRSPRRREEEVHTYRRALASGSEDVSDETVLANLQEICRCSASIPRSRSIRWSIPRGSRRRLAPARAVAEGSDRDESAGRDQDTEPASLRQERGRRVERPRVVRAGEAPAARVAGA